MIRLVLLICGLSLFFLQGCGTSSGRKSMTAEEQKISDSELSQIYVQKGLQYMQMNRLEPALKDLLHALELDPDRADGHYAIALMYTRLKKWPKAEQHFLEAIRLAPENSDARHNYGSFLCDRKRYKEAEEQFVIAVNNPLYQTAYRTYVNAGLCAKRVPDLAKAESYFLMALRLNPKFSQALLQMAQLYLKRGNVLPARAYLQRYREVGALTPQVLWLGVQIEMALDSDNDVASYSLLLKKKFPDSPEAQKLWALESRMRNERNQAQQIINAQTKVEHSPVLQQPRTDNVVPGLKVDVPSSSANPRAAETKLEQKQGSSLQRQVKTPQTLAKIKQFVLTPTKRGRKPISVHWGNDNTNDAVTFSVKPPVKSAAASAITQKVPELVPNKTQPDIGVNNSVKIARVTTPRHNGSALAPVVSKSNQANAAGAAGLDVRSKSAAVNDTTGKTVLPQDMANSGRLQAEVLPSLATKSVAIAKMDDSQASDAWQLYVPDAQQSTISQQSERDPQPY